MTRNKKRFGRIHGKSEEAFELSRLDKKRYEFLGEDRDLERKKRHLAACFVLIIRKRPHFGE